MGIGHVMRCLTLADALRVRGVETLFACRDHPGHLAELLRGRSFEVELLPRSTGGAGRRAEGPYGDWLGASQAEDAEQTIRALHREKLQWLAVDHYALDADWERRLRSHANDLLVIDDLANRPHECSLLIDQNSSSDQNRYDALMPRGCRALLGPRFAMLRPEYRQAGSRARHRSGEVRRVLIFFGGSDPLNLTGMAIDALSRPQFGDLEVDVVIGVNNAHRNSLESAASLWPHIRLYDPQVHLADLMERADLSVGAGGVTMWERMCVGLPGIVVSIAENQRPACASLAKAGLIDYAGHYGAVSANELTSAIHNALARPEALADMSIRGRLAVDGWGAERIAESMYPTAKASLRLRSAVPADLHQYFAWASDTDVRAQAVQMQPISFENHTKWFAGKLESPNSRLFVLLAGDLPVGQIRFDRDGDGETIDYSIDNSYRGRGWGSRLAELGLSQFAARKDTVFHAQVKESNRASQAVFLRLGFTAHPEVAEGLRNFTLTGGPRCE
jgi:UDP-2,4-diacetamido-2,4,6-trideoxy-beta-L-altropyranose hydrolase